jgi:hypothetical protein
VQYDTGAKTARMNAVRELVKGGTLEIGTTDMRTVLASFKLSGTAGVVRDGTWALAFDADSVVAQRAGRASAAHIKDAGGSVRIMGFTVGMDAASDVQISNTQINDRQTVSLPGEQTIIHAR